MLTFDWPNTKRLLSNWLELFCFGSFCINIKLKYRFFLSFHQNNKNNYKCFVVESHWSRRKSALFVYLNQAGCISEAQSWQKMIRESMQVENMESAWSKEVWLVWNSRLVQTFVLFKNKSVSKKKKKDSSQVSPVYLILVYHSIWKKGMEYFFRTWYCLLCFTSCVCGWNPRVWPAFK